MTEATITKKIKTVNIPIQMILSFIPLINFWAWYRIDKIWYGIGLQFTPFLFFIGIIMITAAIETFKIHNIIEINNTNENILLTILYFILFVSSYSPIIYFMYKWSKKWNENIKEKIMEENK